LASPTWTKLARTERFIDALAARQPVEFDDAGDCGDRGDRELAGLLEDWRDELRVAADGCTVLGAGGHRAEPSAGIAPPPPSRFWR